MMRRINLSRVVMIFCCVVLAACSTMQPGSNAADLGYSEKAIWIDVRTVEEYSNDASWAT